MAMRSALRPILCTCTFNGHLLKTRCFHDPKELDSSWSAPSVNPMSASQVDQLLHSSEEDIKVKGHNSRIFTNQISVNRPMEDRLTVAKLVTDLSSDKSSSVSPLVVGVVDGHSGPACAHSVHIRFPDYLATSLMSAVQLEDVHHVLKMHQDCSLSVSLRRSQSELLPELKRLHMQQLHTFVTETLSLDSAETLDEKLSAGLRRLDQDICTGPLAQLKSGQVNKLTLRAALSGCVSTQAVFPSPYIVYILQVGDCAAVLGSKISDDWHAKKLIYEHNIHNHNEIERLTKSHPVSEHESLLRYDRLLGELMPLRAFGDIRFKWSTKDLKEVALRLSLPPSFNPVPHCYYTPPYLTAEPEVLAYPLSRRDRFLILATDGLWDFLSSEDAVTIVGESLDRDVRGEENLATVLIRAALGGQKAGTSPSDDKIARLLSVPPQIARYYRDDISVAVILFNQKFP